MSLSIDNTREHIVKDGRGRIPLRAWVFRMPTDPEFWGCMIFTPDDEVREDRRIFYTELHCVTKIQASRALQLGLAKVKRRIASLGRVYKVVSIGEIELPEDYYGWLNKARFLQSVATR